MLQAQSPGRVFAHPRICIFDGGNQRRDSACIFDYTERPCGIGPRDRLCIVQHADERVDRSRAHHGKRMGSLATGCCRLDEVMFALPLVVPAAIELHIDSRIVAEQWDQMRNRRRRLLAHLGDLAGRRRPLDGIGRTEQANLLL